MQRTNVWEEMTQIHVQIWIASKVKASQSKRGDVGKGGQLIGKVPAGEVGKSVIAELWVVRSEKGHQSKIDKVWQ